MKGAAPEWEGRGERGRWGGMADMASFVGGKGLSLFLSASSLSLSHYSLSVPFCFPCCVFLSSASVSLLRLSRLVSLTLSQSVCCQLALHFLHGPYLFHPPTSPFSLFFITYPSFSAFPAAFHLIYLLLTTSRVLVLYSLPLSPALALVFTPLNYV